jgi:arginine repressor
MTQELFVAANGELIQNTLVKNELVKTEQELLKNLKEQLRTNMTQAGLDRIVNDKYKIMIVGETQNTGINVKAIEKAEPELYVRLLNDYLKITPRKSYVKIEYLA